MLYSEVNSLHSHTIENASVVLLGFIVKEL